MADRAGQPATSSSEAVAEYKRVLQRVLENRPHFLEAYERAHARRLKLVKESRRLRSHTIYLPDLGDETRNHQLEKLVATFITELIRLI